MAVRCAYLAVALCWAMPASAAERSFDPGERWSFAHHRGDRPRFGYTFPNSEHFEVFHFECDPRTKLITAYVGIGEHRPVSGRATVTVNAGGKSATLSGQVPKEPFEGIYQIATVVPPTHPVFAAFTTGGRVRYSGAGGADVLSERGLKTAVERFLSACR